VDIKKDTDIDPQPTLIAAQLCVPNEGDEEVNLETLKGQLPQTPQIAVSAVGWLFMLLLGIFLWYLFFLGTSA
jgi:hypothetical protein